MKLLNTSLKSWLKNLLIEYIYAEQNPNRTWDIWFQSWPFRSEKRLANSTKFWLWRSVPGKWAATWGFMVWLFLSWSIDYQIKNKKTQSGRITSWNFVHPISHCAFSWNSPVLPSEKDVLAKFNRFKTCFCFIIYRAKNCCPPLSSVLQNIPGKILLFKPIDLVALYIGPNR